MNKQKVFMKNKIIKTAIVLFLIIIEYQAITLGLTLMNQPDSTLFFMGLTLIVMTISITLIYISEKKDDLFWFLKK